MPSTLGLLYGTKESIAYSTLLKATTLVASLQLGRLVRRAAVKAATSCVTPELGKCVVCKSSKVSSSDCIRLPVRSTKEPSLILGSLEIALCNLADLDMSPVELQKALQAFLEAFLTSFL
jgi:hypothetical protein